MIRPVPDHLRVERSDRGFSRLPAIPSEYGGDVQVYESSAADGPHVWLQATAPVDLNNPDGPTHTVPIHLTAANAWYLADQLRHLVVGHYQGDARPAAAFTDPTVGELPATSADPIAAGEEDLTHWRRDDMDEIHDEDDDEDDLEDDE